MFSFGTCPSGFRKDCLHKTCLARHIDDESHVSNNDSIKNTLENAARQWGQKQKKRKKYEMRSFSRKMSSPGNSFRFQKPRMADIFENDKDLEDNQDNNKQKQNGYLGKSADYVATGLDNLRNTCYMNSVLQCLAGTEQIMKILGDNTVIAPEGSIYNELKLLLIAITSGEYEKIVPLKFKRKVDEKLGIFAGHRQHDAHDFMCSLLEQIDKEVSLTDGFLNIISGTTEITRRCTKCKKGEPPMKDPFTSLHIEFKENNLGELSVEEAIEELQKTEKFECPCLECGGDESEKQTSITTLPEILTLQIKRFVVDEENLKLTKNHRDVTYPKEMRLGDREYELYASINHIGELTGGHYMTISKQNVTGKWFCYNDDKTREVTVTAKEISSEAYILFYSLIKENEVKNNVTNNINRGDTETIQNGPDDGSPVPLADEPSITNLEENVPCELNDVPTILSLTNEYTPTEKDNYNI